MLRRFAAFYIAITGITTFMTSNLSAADAAPCALLSTADIAKATGLTVSNGTAGPAIPGILGKCTWVANENMKVIVTLADTRHMELTVKAVQQTGGADLPGLGLKAVGNKGAPFTGGGYVVNVLDAKGGFGVSILGKDGTPDRAVALAKVVESHR
jgi:hypothetical protein